MSRIVLTGATGFMGSHLMPLLCQRHEVYALARREAPSQKGVQWIRQDLAQPLDESQLPKSIDTVIHLAQSEHYREFPEQARDIFRVNVQSTQELLEYARRAGAKRFILASSGGVYGSSFKQLSETDLVNPLDFYLSSKYSAELLVGNYKQYFHVIVFRFFFVYGPRQQGKLIPMLLEKVRSQQVITVDGNAGISINPIFIQDALEVFESAMELQNSDLFNIAGDETVTIADLVHLCAHTLGLEAKVRTTSTPLSGDLVGANNHMKRNLNVTPRTRLGEGLSMMAAEVDSRLQEHRCQEVGR